jgi:predicted DNA binding protein
MLERQKTVEYFDLNPVDDRSFYTYIVFQKRPSDERFAEAFQENGVIVVPPVETDRNGVTFTLVGPHEALQALLEDLPEGMDTEILRVGEFDQHHGALAGRLTSRQREAVSAALAVDYYGVPHDATLADVADELGCTVGTVSTLLRRAERAVMEAVVVR